jgi:hypothetical protein
LVQLEKGDQSRVVPNMKDIQRRTENLYESMVDTAKEAKSIKCNNLEELSPRQAEPLECCKKHDKASKVSQDCPALTAEGKLKASPQIAT